MIQVAVSGVIGLLGIAAGWLGATTIERRRQVGTQREAAFARLVGSIARSARGEDAHAEAAQAKALLLVCCEAETATKLRAASDAWFRGSDPAVPPAMVGIVNDLRGSLRLEPLQEDVVMSVLYGRPEDRPGP